MSQTVSKKALVVAPDDLTRRLIADFFGNRGHASSLHSDYGQAIEELATQRFEFVIAQLEPGAPQALNLCRAARHHGGIGTYILVIPVQESAAHLRSAFESGADDYLPPPITVAALQLRMAVGERALVHRRGAAKSSNGDRSFLERRYNALAQNMNEGMFQVDAEGRIEAVNTRMSSLTGYTVEELEGSGADDLLIDAEFRARLPGQTLFGSGIGSEEYTLPLATKDKTRRWVKLVGVPLSLADGSQGALGIVQDLSETRDAEADLKQQKQFFRALLEGSTDLVSIVSKEGQVIYQSPSSRRMLGLPAELMLNQPIEDFIHPDDRATLGATLAAVAERPEDTAKVQARFRAQGGDWLYLDCQCKNHIEDPVLAGIIVTSRDISQRRKVEEALKRERAFFQQLFRNSPAGIVILDNQGRVVDANRSFLQLFQFDIDMLAGRELDELIVPEDLRQEVVDWRESNSDDRAVSRDTQRLRRDQTRIDVSILQFPIEMADRKIGAYGIYNDISESKSIERKLFHEAFHDTLTGLPNRSLLSERLERCVRRAQRRRDYQFALFFIDLDRFKQINDSLGHAAGDQLLIEMAKRLSACLRPGDTVARLGGDEFNIILEDVQEVSFATRIADRILESLSTPVIIGDQEVSTSGSIGIAFSFSGYHSAEDLMRDADIAMYRAKSHGKARYEIFDADMQKGALERLALENELRRAQEQEELVLHFQPIMSLNRSVLLGFEVLTRWKHPQNGLLPPSDWMDVAQGIGLMLPIGRWVLRQACTKLHQWQEQFPEMEGVALSVNLSGSEILHPEFLTEVEKIVEETKIHTASLTFEISEDCLAKPETLVDVLWHLRKLGFRLAIDDFGTGHSSLLSLHRFPIDQLKVDRSLVHQMDPGGDSIEVVRSVALIGESLGIQVIAVGVETSDQLDCIRRLGIHMAQGFELAQPLNAEEAETLLSVEAGG